MKLILFSTLILCTLLGSSAKKVSLNEIVDATLSAKFDAVFVGEEKEASALAILKYSIESTDIDPEYLTNVFYNSLEVSTDEELGQIKYKVENAVDMMNLIIKHFQEAADDAGRPVEKEKKSEKEEL